MSLLSNKELQEFWDLFKNQLNITEVKDENWVTIYSAVKNSNLKRGAITRLIKDDLVRTKPNGEKDILICMLDIAIFDKFLSYFELAKDKDIIQEVDIQGTGNTKYTVIDGRKSRDGKSLTQYQAEIVLGFSKNILENYYDITPKANLEIPEKLRITK